MAATAADLRQILIVSVFAAVAAIFLIACCPARAHIVRAFVIFDVHKIFSLARLNFVIRS